MFRDRRRSRSLTIAFARPVSARSTVVAKMNVSLLAAQAPARKSVVACCSACGQRLHSPTLSSEIAIRARSRREDINAFLGLPGSAVLLDELNLSFRRDEPDQQLLEIEPRELMEW